MVISSLSIPMKVRTFPNYDSPTSPSFKISYFCNFYTVFQKFSTLKLSIGLQPLINCDGWLEDCKQILKLFESRNSTNVSDCKSTFNPNASEQKEDVLYTFRQNMMILSRRLAICFMSSQITYRFFTQNFIQGLKLSILVFFHGKLNNVQVLVVFYHILQLSKFINKTMDPRAVLVLYEPGCKLKNSKYLLSIGVNIVGNDPKCQVHINSRNYFPQDYVANFYLTDDFMYIQALCDNMVQFKSNMQIESSGRKKDVYRYIDKNCRYILPMQQIFYIGPYKAIVQVQASHQLKQINNLINLQHFETPQGQNQKNQQKIQNCFQDLKNQIQNDPNDAESDGTQKIQSQQENYFQPTLVIEDNDPYVYQPTLALEDEDHIAGSQNKKFSQSNHLLVNHSLLPQMIQNKSPIRSPLRSPVVSNSQDSHTKSLMKRPNNPSQLSDISMFSRQKKCNGFSQQALYETIRKEESQHQRNMNDDQLLQEDDISMPDTIQDNCEEINKQQEVEGQVDDMPPTIQDQDNQMPPTIQQDHQQQEKNSQVAKSMYEKKESFQSLNSNKLLYKSQRFSKPEKQCDEIDDIFDLFEKTDIKKIDSNQPEIEEKKQIIKKPLFSYEVSTFRNQKVLPHVNIQEFNSSNNPMIKSNASSINAQKTEKLNAVNLSTQKKGKCSFVQESGSVIPRKKLFKESQKPKLANCTGFKPKPEDKITLRKRGYQIVPDARIQDYDILIIGKNNHASEKLLMAILLDKQILTEDWIRDKDWEQNKKVKIEGTIEGISWSLIDKQRGKRDIFSNAGVFYFTDQLSDFAKVFQTAGGSITQQLNKRKKTNLVINCEVEADKEFYTQSKSCKNWKFYSYKLIGQSILIGQAQFKKYIVDETSF